MLPSPIRLTRGAASAVAVAIALVALACGETDEAPPSPGPAGLEAGPSEGDASAPAPSDADAGPVADARGLDALFVGNSYVYVNDVAGRYAAIARAFSPTVRVEQVTKGGYRLAQHAADARTDGTPLARALRAPAETRFDAVTLQEQSQEGGFQINSRLASIEAFSQLAALARAMAARVVLYETWGYRDGDPSNGLIGYGTYTGMQDRLDLAYHATATRLGEEGADVRVAPVGGAFRVVHEDVTRAGGDPAAVGSAFHALYEADGSHPSPRGAYLAACVLVGTVRRGDARAFADDPALGPELSRTLKDACARALADRRWSVPVVRREEAALLGVGNLGWGVAASRAGERVVVGARGGARVFARADGGLAEEAAWTGPGGVGFGTSVALAADGARAVVGAPAVVFDRAVSTWTAGPTLPVAQPGTTWNPASVALSGDGTRALLAGPPAAGAPEVVARALRREGTAWVEEPLTLSAPSADAFGPSVALDAAGTRAIVGASGGSLARVFARTGTAWVEEAALASEPRGAARVALSGDGAVAVVGLPDFAEVRVFERAGTNWTEAARLRGYRGSLYGHAVSSSADGQRIALGVPFDEPATRGMPCGSARVFERRAEGWVEALHLAPREPKNADRFGLAVALSPDGRSAIVGAPYWWDASPNQGRAFMFALP